MSQLLKLQNSLLLKIVYYLDLQELQQLAQTCRQLHAVVYNNPRVWHQYVLFPPKNPRITDKFIQKLVPQITRHYGIQTLRLIQLPLTWLGYLFVFDQFAHSVDYIQVETTCSVLQDLVHHLTVFATNLIVLQQDNHIPITFREYCRTAPYYYQVLVDHHFLGETSVAHITRLFANPNGNTSKGRLATLDDPPFERLRQWQAVCTDHPQRTECIAQLQSLVSFLAGRHVGDGASTSSLTSIVTSPIITGQKRAQDHLEQSTRQKQRLTPSSHASSLYV